MIQPIDLTNHRLLAVSRASLAALRLAVMREAGPAGAACFQEAGYAGGDAVFESFRQWLRGQGKAGPDELDVSEFQHRASLYFKALGWGTMSVSVLHEMVAAVDSADWHEAEPEGGLDQPSCHFTTGMFADFFGRISDAPLAVLEVECRSMGAPRCRFLLGNSDVLQYVFTEIEKGVSYTDAIATLG